MTNDLPSLTGTELDAIAADYETIPPWAIRDTKTTVRRLLATIAALQKENADLRTFLVQPCAMCDGTGSAFLNKEYSEGCILCAGVGRIVKCGACSVVLGPDRSTPSTGAGNG